MKNRDVFQTDPASYRIVNQGVSKIVFPPPNTLSIDTLKGEVSTFVSDGEYGRGLVRILEAFLRDVGKANQSCVWISGFYGSGKSHLANMLCALWTDYSFSDGANASGLVQGMPDDVAAVLRELRNAAKRGGGVHAAGGTLGGGPDSPILAALGIVLQSVGLPVDFRAARVAFWLEDEGILSTVQKRLAKTFDEDIRNFVLATRFHEAVLAEKPKLAKDAKELRDLLRATFPQPPAITVTDLSTMTRRALLLGKKELPLTLIALDETQQFIRNDPSRTLDIQNIAERFQADFDGRLLLVCTGQQALNDVPDLQKLLGRFSTRVSLGEADMDAVIRKTVLRKKPGARENIRKMLDARAGEVSRHLSGSKLAHTRDDDDDAILDWPLLPSRRRVWERILRSLDKSGLAGTLRTQLSVSLEAARAVADRPLGHAVPTDFLYSRFADDAYSAGLLPEETRAKIEKLRASRNLDPLKARVLMVVYMLGRIQGDADQHGVRPTAEMIADLLVDDLEAGADVRRKVPEALSSLRDDGAVLEIGSEWRLQTKESADWEAAYKVEERARQSSAADIARERRNALEEALGTALSSALTIQHGRSAQTRRVQRVRADEKAPGDGIVLRIHSGWEADLEAVKKDIAAAPPTDATIHLLLPREQPDALQAAFVQRLAAQSVIDQKGAPQTTEGKEARDAMQSRVTAAQRQIDSVVKAAVSKATILQAGGAVVSGGLAEAVRTGATNALARLYPQFADGDHPGWERVVEQARKGQPDAIKSVDHNGMPETHPVCRTILGALGAGRKGSDLRKHFTDAPYGWSQDAVDGALLVLDNAGHLRVTGEDGQATALRSLDRRKTGLCTFRAETTTVTTHQRLAVRGLLTDIGVPFERDQEAAVLPRLLERLAEIAGAAGGDAPAPLAPGVPGLAEMRALSGNDLLVEVATRAPALREALKHWRDAALAIRKRLPDFQTAEQLVSLGATGQAASLGAIRDGRKLLDDPDPLPPILQDAAAELRTRLNGAFENYENAWAAAETRLNEDALWQRLTPEQRHTIRQEVGLMPVSRPSVAKPEDIVAALKARPLPAWQDLAKALPQRVADALADAAALLEPKARAVSLPAAGVLKDEAQVDAWVREVRSALMAGLKGGPVIPNL